MLLTVVASVLLGPIAVLALVVASIPGAASSTAGMICSSETGPGAPPPDNLDEQQQRVATEIVAVGREKGLPREAWVIAVDTAWVESRLQELTYGDRDSLGPFQQRESGWGPPETRIKTRSSATLFYQRLVALNPPWQSTPLSLTSQDNPAQRVQKSAFPARYAQERERAMRIVGWVEGVECVQPVNREGDAHHPLAGEVVKRAREVAQQAVPYAWGGGDRNGPTLGIRDGGVADAHGDYRKVGFDCSGLVTYAWAAADVDIPSQTRQIWETLQGSQLDRSELLPGDLILLSTNATPDGIHHVGLYIGNNEVIEAPQSGEHVQITRDIWKDGSRYQQEFFAAVRPGVAPSRS